MAAFDINAALAEGYTKRQIADYLASEENFDAEAARKEGYSDDHIIGELTGKPFKADQPTGPVNKNIESPELLEMVGQGAGAAYGIGETALRGFGGNIVKRVAREIKQELKHPEDLGVTPTQTTPAGQPTTLKPGEKYGIAMHGNVYTTSPDMSKIYQAGKEAENVKTEMPGWRMLTGGSKLVVPEKAATEYAERQALASAEPIVRLTPQQKAAMALTGPSAQRAVAAAHLVGRVAAPVYGLGQTGLGTAQIVNRFQEGTTPREKAAGVVNAAGALAGLGTLYQKPKIKYPAAALSGSLNWLADKIAGEQEAQQKAAGGLAHLKNGKQVKEAFEYGGKQLGKLSDWAQDYIGNYFVPTQSDRMRYVGGPSFSANQLGHPEYKDIVWGSGKPGTATGIANLAKDPRFGGVENQIFAPLLGEAKMHQSNQMIFDRMVEDFFKNPEKLTPELRQTINDYIRSGGLAVSGTKKSKSFEPIPEFDIANRQMIESLGKTFDNRKLIAQHAFGGKDIGGRKAQIIPYEKILQETTDPTVLGAPTFSMGPRAFKLTGETLDVPRHDLNPAYPYKLLGQDLGVTYNPAPSELSLMDFQRKWRQDTGKTTPLKSGALPQPGYYEHTMGYTPAGSSERIYPRQKITESWIKDLQRSGFNQGGLTE